MTDLIHGARAAGSAFVDCPADRADIAVEEINVAPIDDQPAAAVDPGTPLAESGYEPRLMPIVEFLGRAGKFIDRKWLLGFVVEADIDVGIRVRGCARTRSAENDCGDSSHALDARGDAIEQRLER